MAERPSFTDFLLSRRVWWYGDDWHKEPPAEPIYQQAITVGKEITIEFDYPLDEPHRMTLPVPAGDFTYVVLAGMIADAYQTIYDDPDKYKIWGHSLADLVLERVYYNDGVFKLAIGS